MGGTAETARFELLAAVGRVADGTLLLGETVQRLLRVVVPAVADLATLDAVSPSGELRRLGVRMRDPGDPAAEAAILRRQQPPTAGVGVMRAVAGGESQLLSPVSEAHLQQIASSEADLELLRALGVTDAMFIPLRARGRIVGALACSMTSSGRRLDASDVEFAEVLGGRIALALDNAGLAETVSGLEQRLEATLANLAEAVIVRDAAGRMLFTNPAAAELLGALSLAELTTATSADLMARYEAYDEAGRRLGLEQLPSAAALRGERPPPLLVRNVARSTGRTRWLLHKATPVFDPNGALSMAVNVIEDVTEPKRAELAQRLLAEAGRALASSLDYEQTLQRIARLAVPGLADWCGVAMRGLRDELRQVAVAHADPDKVALAREWAARYPPHLTNPSGAARVIRSGRPEIIRELTEDLITRLPATEEQRSLVRALGMRSVIFVPLAVPGRPPFGALSLIMAESGRRFDDDDLAVAEELGRRAAIAVENSRLYTERSRIAATLQESLLPPRLSEIPGCSLATLYHPAGEESEVGGDFYDAFAVPGGWMVLVGDVAGHGAEAAALTSMSRYTLRTAGKLLGDPVAALDQLNRALCERPLFSLVSVCCVRLREADGEAVADVVLAGHPPAYHLHDGEVEPAGVLARLLGVTEGGNWMAESVRLSIGDQLVLYTDGVTDTVGANGRFGSDRLTGTLRGAVDPADTVARVERALGRFARGPQRDDTAVLVVQRTSSASFADVADAGEAARPVSAPSPVGGRSRVSASR
ncbi:MAG TPA: SpoIIE family protein phosphatase [Solirubrobacteraceae bacterium]|nr:SpoIIE family protein phosphatase [Solirubrobacteraceae bacterium]